MRVLHVVTKADVGGAQTYVLELATAQMASGDTVAISAGSVGVMAAEAERRGLTVMSSPHLHREIGLRSELAALRGLREQIAEFSPDVVHAHSSKAGVLVRVATRRRVPAVYTAHGWPFQAGAPLAQRMVSWLGETLAAHWWGEVICLTDAEKALARRWRVVSPRRLHVVPNGLPDVEEHLRADLRVREPGAPVVIVMVARFAPPKSQRRVLDAVTAMRPGGWRLDLVGDGPQLEECRAAATALGLDDRVRFLGHRDDVGELLLASDIGLLWSRYEGMPLALMEAMRAGLACVANDLDGTRLLLADGASGLLVPFEDGALTTVLQRLVDDSDGRRGLAAAARARFENLFSIEGNERRVRQVYDSAINAMRRGGGSAS